MCFPFFFIYLLFVCLLVIGSDMLRSRDHLFNCLPTSKKELREYWTVCKAFIKHQVQNHELWIFTTSLSWGWWYTPVLALKYNNFQTHKSRGGLFLHFVMLDLFSADGHMASAHYIPNLCMKSTVQIQNHFLCTIFTPEPCHIPFIIIQSHLVHFSVSSIQKLQL